MRPVSTRGSSRDAAAPAAPAAPPPRASAKSAPFAALRFATANTPCTGGTDPRGRNTHSAGSRRRSKISVTIVGELDDSASATIGTHSVSTSIISRGVNSKRSKNAVSADRLPQLRSHGSHSRPSSRRPSGVRGTRTSSSSSSSSSIGGRGGAGRGRSDHDIHKSSQDSSNAKTDSNGGVRATSGPTLPMLDDMATPPSVRSGISGPVDNGQLSRNPRSVQVMNLEALLVFLRISGGGTTASVPPPLSTDTMRRLDAHPLSAELLSRMEAYNEARSPQRSGGYSDNTSSASFSFSMPSLPANMSEGMRVNDNSDGADNGTTATANGGHPRAVPLAPTSCTICQRSFHCILVNTAAAVAQAAGTGSGEQHLHQQHSAPQAGRRHASDVANVLDGVDTTMLSQRLVRLPCHHVYCEACLSEWLQRTSTCPNCRLPLNDSGNIIAQYQQSGAACEPANALCAPAWWPATAIAAITSPSAGGEGANTPLVPRPPSKKPADLPRSGSSNSNSSVHIVPRRGTSPPSANNINTVDPSQIVPHVPPARQLSGSGFVNGHQRLTQSSETQGCLAPGTPSRRPPRPPQQLPQPEQRQHMHLSHAPLQPTCNPPSEETAEYPYFADIVAHPTPVGDCPPRERSTDSSNSSSGGEGDDSSADASGGARACTPPTASKTKASVLAAASIRSLVSSADGEMGAKDRDRDVDDNANGDFTTFIIAHNERDRHPASPEVTEHEKEEEGVARAGSDGSDVSSNFLGSILDESDAEGEDGDASANEEAAVAEDSGKREHEREVRGNDGDRITSLEDHDDVQDTEGTVASSDAATANDNVSNMSGGTFGASSDDESSESKQDSNDDDGSDDESDDMCSFEEDESEEYENEDGDGGHAEHTDGAAADLPRTAPFRRGQLAETPQRGGNTTTAPSHGAGASSSSDAAIATSAMTVYVSEDDDDDGAGQFSEFFH